MKKVIIVINILLILAHLNSAKAQTFNKSFTHDNIVRTYEIYIPQNYTGNTSVPLIINYHGFTSNGFQQSFLANFQPIADSAGFIIVHPTGTTLPPPISLTYWNVGGFTNGGTADDISFTSDLIDTIAANYNINMMRVYACGLSNGGFFSHKLACELGHRIAAIASVAGTFTPQMQAACNPTHPTPVLQIHGTADSTVPYIGTTQAGGMAAVDTVIDYWVTYNNCATTPAISQIPNINIADGSTAERYIYSGGNAGVNVELIKIINGGHHWPGFSGNMDFNASLEIWKFFSRYSNTAVKVDDVSAKEFEVNIYPNPAINSIQIVRKKNNAEPYEITTIDGRILKKGTLETNPTTLNISSLAENMYILKINNTAIKFLKSN